MNRRKHSKIRRLPAFLLAVVLCLTLAAPALAADDATASSIQLAKTEGTVSATNSAGRNISLVKNLRLFSGYHVLTEASSYAWLNLDSAKLLKEDASSNVEVRKSGKKLEVLLSSGNLFFNVTEPLDDDETLNIRTSTTLTGVRGTCGWVEVIDRWNTDVYILEGKVECVVTDPVSGENELTTVSAGETATFTVSPGGSSAANKVEISKTSCDVEDVPGYVLVELAEDEALCGDILDASGLDILGELSKGGDAAAEAQRRLEEEEAAAARRLASIAAREQAQASKVEAAPNTPGTPASSGELNMVGNWGWRYDEGTKTLYIGGSGDMRDYLSHGDIPWDKQRKEIESIVIGNGITSIGGDAFYGCSSLTSVTIPDSVTRIGGDSFFDCNNLPSVTIPNGVTSIGTNAFNHCNSLTSVTLPSSLTFINNSAFAFCRNLTDVYYGGSAEQWSAISIGEVGNDPLTSATIHYAGASGTPGDLTTEGNWSWRYNESTKTLYVEGSGAMDDFRNDNKAPWLEQYRKEIESVVIGSGITHIGDYSFNDCSSLSRVTIPSGVTSIGVFAFARCDSLTSVTFPAGMTSIGKEAFFHCDSLTSVTLPNSVTSIGSSAFQFTNLTSVTLPNGLTVIENSAFRSCHSLASLTIPSSVTVIKAAAFSDGYALTSVVIPDGVTTLENNIFGGCRALKSISIPTSVTSIGDYTFQLCSRLTDVYYGGSEAQWNAIDIGSTKNEPLTSATIHYNSR